MKISAGEPNDSRIRRKFSDIVLISAQDSIIDRLDVFRTVVVRGRTYRVAARGGAFFH